MIRWDHVSPFCSSCRQHYCHHVLVAIRDRADDLPLLQAVPSEFTIPLRSSSWWGHNQVPKVTVFLNHLEPNTTELFVDLGGEKQQFAGFLLDSQLHRRDVAVAVLPFLYVWQVEHPCHCNAINQIVAGEEEKVSLFAAMAAYRIMDHLPVDNCLRCNTSDLIPDVTPPGRKGSSKKQPARSGNHV